MLGQPLLSNHSGESLGYMTLSKDEEGGRGRLKTMMDWEDGRHTRHSAIPPRVRNGCHVDFPIWKKQQRALAESKQEARPAARTPGHAF